MVILRDRTKELHQIFASLKAQQGIGGGSVGLAAPHSSSVGSSSSVGGGPSPPSGGGGANRKPATAETQRFFTFAQEFSKELSNVSDTIGNMAKLIQQQNVFDDQAPEISSLTGIVKTKLAQLHDDLNVLADLKEDAEAQHRSGFLSSGKKTQSDQHSSNVIDALRSRLVHTSQSFKSTLQTRTRSMKDAANRRSRYTSDRPTSFESALFKHDDQQQEGSGGGGGGMGGGAYGDTQSTTLSMATNNTQYFRQRHEAVRQIEAAVNEVGEMFQDFTRLVHEQEEMVVRIDTDVDDAVRDVDAGSSELMRYLSNLSSNRGLILKIFAVLFVFLLFFGFVVVR